MPPTSPALPVFDSLAAMMPSRYVACSSSKTIGETFLATELPEVVMNTVFGYCAPAFMAASWNSKPWPKARSKPFAP